MSKETSAIQIVPQPGQPLGIIGLGLLGGALAERALTGGLAVLGFDLDDGRRASCQQSGGQVAASAKGWPRRWRNSNN